MIDPAALLEEGRRLMLAGRRRQAVAAVFQALGSAPDNARLHNRAGEVLARLGHAVEAERAFLRALSLEPALAAAARYNIALLRLSAGDHEQAAGLLLAVTRERPGLPAAWLQLGGALNALGRYEAAEAALRRHLGLSRDSPPGWIWLGAALQFQGRFDEAEACYRRALSVDPDNADAHTNLGRLLQAQGMPSAAETCLGRALSLAPGHRQARAGLAALRDNDGRYEEALALATEPDGTLPPETVAIGARALRHLERFDEARRSLEAALAIHGLPAEAEVQLRFSLGRVLDESGDPVAATACLIEANRRLRDRFGEGAAAADLAALAAAAADLESAFSAEAMTALPRSGCTSRQPLFIVGMPRAGKSLVEQILCSHPEVHGAGELTEIAATAERLGREWGGWPHGVSRVTQTALLAGAQAYLGRLEGLAAGAARVTDTMPFNFMHLGLIELLFPRARIVHCVRHPADLALRCYAKNFAGRSLAFTADLGDIASYLEGYRRIMHHWRAVSGLAMQTVRYETLVREPDATTRTLIEFAGLSWSEDCLRFFEPGVATSASDTPVRRPLDDGEIGGWQAYRPLLAGVLDRLDLDAYGDEGL